MSYSKADYQDVDVILRLYELRRETVMRQSRDLLNGGFWPKSFDDLAAVADWQHPMNAAWRQVTTYWEMVYSFARNGIINPDFLIESNGEGLLLYAKIHEFLPQYRKEMNAPFLMQSAEWIVANSEAAKKRFEMMKARVAKYMQKLVS